MYCLRTMKGDWEQPQRAAVVKWFLNAQEQKWRGGASFPGYMRDMWKETLATFPEAERKAAEDEMDAYTPPPVTTTTGRPRQLGDDATRLSVTELREYMTLDPMAYTGVADPRRTGLHEGPVCRLPQARRHRPGVRARPHGRRPAVRPRRPAGRRS